MAVISMLDFTREFYRVPVTFAVAGVVEDPTSLAIEFAVVARGSRPASGDWLGGSWETTADGQHLARILVGDAAVVAEGGVEITAGNYYDVYFRLTDNPERPARLVGQIQAI